MARDIPKSFSTFLSTLLCLFCVAKAEYKELLLSSGKVCKLDSDSSVLRIYPPGEDSQIIIKDGDYFKSFTGRYGFSCNFKVKVKDRGNNHGIYVTIQKLNFRKDSSNECLDYVDISVPKVFLKIYKGSKDSQRFCGNIRPQVWDESSNGFFSSYALAPNSFIAPNGEVEVTIHMANERLQGSEELFASIAFTTFRKDCYDEGSHLISCIRGECIHGDLKNDGVQNCPYRTCADENGCQAFSYDSDEDVSDPKPWPKYFAGTGPAEPLTFAAIGLTTIIILFGLCLYLYKRCRRRQIQERPRYRATLPTSPNPPEGITELPASAPPVSEIFEIKDPPPSYESLFPADSSRPVETNT